MCHLGMATCTVAHLSVEFWNDLFQLVEHCVGLGAIDVVAKLVLWPAGDSDEQELTITGHSS